MSGRPASSKPTAVNEPNACAGSAPSPASPPPSSPSSAKTPLRLTAMTRMAEDPTLALWQAAIGLGPDAVPDLIFQEAFSHRLLAA